MRIQKIRSKRPTKTHLLDEMAAPIFSGTDQNGVVHRLEDYEGKVIFLNFWATWCGPVMLKFLMFRNYMKIMEEK